MHAIHAFNRTSNADLPLFRKLGMTPFSNMPCGVDCLVGVVELEDSDSENPATVTVLVNCMPAQFWTLRVRNGNGKVTEFGTGSGKLSDFWRFAEMIAGGMISVESVTK